MIIFLAVILVVISLICIALFAPTRVIAEYYGGELKLHIRIWFFRFSLSGSKLMQRDKKQKDKKAAGGTQKTPNADENAPKSGKAASSEETPESFFEKINVLKSQYLEFKDLIDIFLSSTKNKIEFSKIYVGIAYGTGEAASTGVLYGAFWVLVGNIYSFVSKFYRVAFPQIKLTPSYNRAMFKIEAEGIISLKFVHIITALLRVFKQIRKNKQKK